MSWRGEEELRFDPATKTWELVESVVGASALTLPWSNAGMCELNGVLYCDDVYFRKVIVGFDEVTGALKELKLESEGLWPNQLLDTRLTNVGGRLAIMGWTNQLAIAYLGIKIGISCAEVGVKKDGDGNLRGEVLRSEMVCSTRASLRDRETTHFVC